MKLTDEMVGNLDGWSTHFRYDVTRLADRDSMPYSTRLWYLHNSLKGIVDLAQTLLPELDRLMEGWELADNLTPAQRESLRIAYSAAQDEASAWGSNHNAIRRESNGLTYYWIYRSTGDALARKGLLEHAGAGIFLITNLGKMIAEALHEQPDNDN